MAKVVVILGAGWAGLPLAHKLLKYSVPKHSTGLKIILVSPNTHFFWNVAATRGIIPGEIPDDSLFLPIKPAFDHYSSDNFEFVVGRADEIKQNDNMVDIILENGDHRRISYDQLVIATGSRATGDLPLKPIGTHESTLTAWHSLQGRISQARSIIVSGAGPTGIEVAGELASKYGATKEITLISSGELLPGTQPSVLPSLRRNLENGLEQLGIKVVKGVRVREVHETDNRTHVKLENNSDLVADVYLPFHGYRLNTSFIPPKWLDESAQVKLDDYMRVVGTTNVWAIGDVGNKETKQLTVTDNQIIYLSSTLDAVLSGQQSLKPYQPDSKTMIFLSLGKKHGTGQIGNWKLFGFMVNYVKGRQLFVDTAEGYVNGKHLRHAAM